MAREADTSFNDEGRRNTGTNSPDYGVIDSKPESRGSQAQVSPWIAFLRARISQKDQRRSSKASFFSIAGWMPDAADRERLRQSQGLLWTGFGFAGGIYIYSILPEEPDWLVLGVLFAAILASAAFLGWRSGLSSRVVLALALLAGLSAATFRSAWVDAPRLAEPMTVLLRGEVLDLQRRNSGNRLSLKVAAVNGLMVNGLAVNGSANAASVFAERVRLRVPEETSVQPGDWVQLRARLFPPMGPVVPGGYDFSYRAYFQGIGASGFSYGVPEIVNGPPSSFYRKAARFIDHVRGHLARRIAAVLPQGPEAALAVALLVGDRSGIDDETEESLRAAGLAHILAISGLHMALFAGGAYGVCLGLLALVPGFALRFPLHKFAALLALAAATIYLLLSGASVATQRSFIMIALVFLGILTGRRGLTLRSVALAGLFLLLLAPERLFFPGFQMSFAAVIALIAVYDLWRGFERRHVFRAKSRSVPARLLANAAKWGTGLFVTALVAGTATGIVGAYHFSRVAPFGVVGNMLGMPVFSIVVMPMGVLALVLMPFGLSAVPLKAMSAGLSALIEVASFTENIAPDVGRIGALSGPAAVLLMAGVFFGLLMPGRLRLVCLIPLCVGLSCQILSRPPDIRIASTGNQIAARDPQGLLRLSSARKSFGAETWLEAEGLELQSIKSRKMKSPQRRCDDGGCVVSAYASRVAASSRSLPLKIAVPTTIEALSRDCRKADIIVTDMIVPKTCRARLVIDRKVRADRGAVSLWLDAPGFRGQSGRAPDQRTGAVPAPDIHADKPQIRKIEFAKPKPPRPWHRQGTITRASVWPENN